MANKSPTVSLIVGWLVIAIVCAANSVDCVNMVTSCLGSLCPGRNIDKIRAKEVFERTADDWKALDRFTFKKLVEKTPEKTPDEMSSGEVADVLQLLKDVGDIKNQNYYYHKYETAALDYVNELIILEHFNGSSCNDKRFLTILAAGLVKTRDKFPPVYNYVNTRFVDHLKACGYEDTIKQLTTLVKSDKQVGTLLDSSSLADYLTGKFWQQAKENFFDVSKEIGWAVSLVGKLTACNEQALDETKCENYTYIGELSRGNEHAKQFYPELTTYVNYCFTRQSTVCLGHFKTMMQQFIDNNSQEWTIIESFTATAEKHLMPLMGEIYPDKSRRNKMLHALTRAYEQIRDGHWDGDKYGFKSVDLHRDFGAACKPLFNSIYPSLLSVSVNLSSAKQDPQILNWLMHVHYCSLLLEPSYNPFDSIFPNLYDDN